MAKKKLTFEESLMALEQVVQALDGGEVTLDEGLKLFKEGLALVEDCTKALDKAEGEIKILLGEDVVDFTVTEQ